MLLFISISIKYNFHHFIWNVCVPLALKWVSFIGIYRWILLLLFLNPKLYPMILSGVFIPLTFNRIIDKYILLFYCLFLFLSLSFVFKSSLFFVFNYFTLFLSSLVAQMVNVCLQCGRPRFNPWVGMVSWRRKWQPILVFLLGESQGRRSLEGCRLWCLWVAHGWSDLAAAASILAWKSHGWGLVNYSPWGRKKSERIERLHFHFHSFLSCSLMVHLILCIYNFIFSICTLIAGFDLCLLWSSYILTYNYTTYFKLIII